MRPEFLPRAASTTPHTVDPPLSPQRPLPRAAADDTAAGTAGRAIGETALPAEEAKQGGRNSRDVEVKWLPLSFNISITFLPRVYTVCFRGSLSADGSPTQLPW